MPRKPDVDPPVALEVSLPTTVRARLDLHLFSDLEGRVPVGAYKRFFMERISEFFGTRALDLHPYGFPQGTVVRGLPEVIEQLQERLRRT